MIMGLGHPRKLGVIGTSPAPAAMPSLNQKIQRNSCPSQKTGAETPKSANPIAIRSKAERGFRAERIPIGIPRQSHTTDAPRASDRVTSILSQRIGFSGERVLKENPKPG